MSERGAAAMALDGVPVADQVAIGRCLRLVEDRSGLVFIDERLPLFERRVRSRAADLTGGDLAGYAAALSAADPAGELDRLIDAVTVQQTSFFRLRRQLEWLADDLVPGRVGSLAPLRIWSAGCATGEEVWSVAMTVAAADPTVAARTTVVGTDISAAAVEHARAARYHHSRLDEVPQRLRRRFVEGDRVRSELLPAVAFAVGNVVDIDPDGPFDVAFLRNVLMYLGPAARTQAVHNVLGSLRPGGCLVVGPTEGIDHLLGGLERIGPMVFRTEPRR